MLRLEASTVYEKKCKRLSHMVALALFVGATASQQTAKRTTEYCT
jgi:hypothetical protein